MNVVSIHFLTQAGSYSVQQVTAADYADSPTGNLHCTFSHVSCLFYRRSLCSCVYLLVVTEGPPSNWNRFIRCNYKAETESGWSHVLLVTETN